MQNDLDKLDKLDKLDELTLIINDEFIGPLEKDAWINLKSQSHVALPLGFRLVEFWPPQERQRRAAFNAFKAVIVLWMAKGYLVKVDTKA